jgi:hypothetical protein
MSRILGELQRRRVFQVAAMYAAVAFIALQVADLTFPTLGLSESAYHALVWLLVAGFPIALVLSWFFDIRVVAGSEPASVPHTPRGRYRLVSVAVIVMLAACAGGVTAMRGLVTAPYARDGRIPVAVFPFRAVGTGDAEWSEGIADLLSTALDGTEGLRVIDPWALWRPLRSRPDAIAPSPDPEQAAAFARDVGARRMVLGSAIANGDRIELSLRVYDPRVARPLHTFARTAARHELAAVVDRLAIDVITRIWDKEVLPGMTRLEPNVTQSRDALKAYLAAKIAMRRGLVDSAAVAIERAITLDSTFALALVDAVAIQSWYQFSTGRQYNGFGELLARARAHSDSLAPRYRLRLDATSASVDTRGADAAAALGKVLESDSMDIAAWAMLSYVHGVYGWQYGATPYDAIAATRRVIQLDSSYVPGLVAQAWQELAGDSSDLQLYVTRLQQVDTSVMLARATLHALRALQAEPAQFEVLKETLAQRSMPDWVAALRYLRAYDPPRALALLTALRARPADPATSVVASNHARQLITQGRTAAVDSAIRAGDYQRPDVLPGVQRLLVASALAGVADANAARRAADALLRYVPLDSAVAFQRTRPSSWVVWLAGAYHAQEGDTTLARRAQRVIASLDSGGSPATYREALAADIEARLAARNNDVQRALAAARRAYDLWTVHTENQPESMPEPAIRFHLASLLRAHGDAAEAERLMASLVPPTTWFGFYTARAHFELGEMSLARGDSAAARRHFTAAIRYWGEGGPEIAPWLQRAKERLTQAIRPA